MPRDQIFITTKLAYVSDLPIGRGTDTQSSASEHRWHHPGREEEAIDRSLKNLGVDYVDLVGLSLYSVVAGISDRLTMCSG